MLRLLAHGDPHIGIDRVGPHNRRHRVGTDFDAAPVERGTLLAPFHDPRVGCQGIRRGIDKVNPRLGTADHQGGGYIVAPIPHIDDFESLEAAEALTNRKQVSQSLGRVIVIGETIPHGHAAM